MFICIQMVQELLRPTSHRNSRKGSRESQIGGQAGRTNGVEMIKRNRNALNVSGMNGGEKERGGERGCGRGSGEGEVQQNVSDGRLISGRMDVTEDMRVLDYDQDTPLDLGSTFQTIPSDSVSVIPLAERAAIDRLLAEHRSEIIKLGFLRHNHRNSRLSSRLNTPLSTTLSSPTESVRSKVKRRGNSNLIDSWGNENYDGKNSENDQRKVVVGMNNISNNNNNDDSDGDDDDNYHRHYDKRDNNGKSEKTVNIDTNKVSNPYREVSELLETRILEAGKSQKTRRNLPKKSAPKIENENGLKNKKETSKILFSNLEGNFNVREIALKSPFWNDNGIEDDRKKSSIRFPHIVPPNNMDEKVDENLTFLPPPQSRRNYYQDLSNGGILKSDPGSACCIVDGGGVNRGEDIDTGSDSDRDSDRGGDCEIESDNSNGNSRHVEIDENEDIQVIAKTKENNNEDNSHEENSDDDEDDDDSNRSIRNHK